MEVINGVEVDVEQLKHDWEENGYLFLKGIVSKTELQQLKARGEQMLEEFDPAKEMENEGLYIFSSRSQAKEENKGDADKYFLNSGGKIKCFFEENAFDENRQLKQKKEHSINKIAHALHDLDPLFDKFSRQPAFARLAEILGYKQPLLLQSMIIFKQPKIGGEVLPHQDSTFLYTDPMSCLGYWMPMEPATKENGCLWVLPGSHKGLRDGRRFVRTEKNQTTMVPQVTPIPDDPWKDYSKYIPVECEEGDLLLIHGCVVHMSYGNTSDKSRHAYTFHIIEGEASYPSDNWLQREEPLRGF